MPLNSIVSTASRICFLQGQRSEKRSLSVIFKYQHHEREGLRGRTTPMQRATPPDSGRRQLLEFKALSLKAVGLTSAELAAKNRDELRTMPAVAEPLREAEQQLAAYRDVLERSAGATLKLRTHAVVGIGLERLVW